MKRPNHFGAWLAILTYFLALVALEKVGWNGSLPWLSSLFRELGFGWRAEAGERFSTTIIVACFFYLIFGTFSSSPFSFRGGRSYERSIFLPGLSIFLMYTGLGIVGLGLFGQKLTQASLSTAPGEFCFAALIALVASSWLSALVEFVRLTYQSLRRRY